MDNLAERISQLSPEQLAKLTQKLQQKQPQTTAIPVLPRDTDRFPLSFAQQRLWFLHQLQPESPFYNVPAAIRITGPLNVSILERSLTAMLDRHEPLRTIFGVDSGQTPVQVIQPASHWSLEVIDLQNVSSEQQQQQVEQLKTATAETPFDLAKGPLLRTQLIRLAPDRYSLYICFHHVITDGWALQLFVQELSVLYQAFQRDLPSPLKPLTVQYVDYAAWQRQYLKKETSSSHVNYWLEQLEGVPTVLELPTDYARPPIQSLQGARYPIKLEASLTQALNRFSQAEGTTLFMTVLAAFNVLLYRYTSQTDLLVGTPVANRNQVATEKLMGVLVNMLALRTQLQGKDSFHQLLQQIKTTVVDANAHQNLPFEQLIDAMQPQRSPSYAPLIQVVLTVQAAPMERLICGDLVLEPEALDTGTSQFDLTLQLFETKEGLQGSFEYNTDLFKAATIHRMASHLQMILETIVLKPHSTIADIPLLTVDERETILQQWNQTQVDFPQVALHTLFEQQVEQSPHSAAVVFEQKRLSYAELNTRANQLAHHLQAAGVGPETLVGIYLERSIDLVVGLLAILKAGGAYVPLDPSYPQARLEYMVEDANISLLLTQSKLATTLSASQVQVISIDTDETDIANSSSANPLISVLPENLAYVIYTSGSTGQPKGVAIPHRGLVNYLSWCIEAYDVAAGSGTLVHSSIGFDATITGLFAPLLVGNPLVLVSSEQELEGLSQSLETYQNLSLVKLTPAHLELLSQTLSPATLAGQSRALVIGGEALHGHHIDFWRTHAPATRLINEYGPTETVVGCCVHEVTADEEMTGPVPIGRPIANTQLYVLDGQQRPVAVGIVGELYIGGAGVARGYLNRPELTAAKFIANPFGKGRLYRTGDLARYRDNSCLEYWGRIDTQVKIRGFRIELGEIETVLNRQEQVQQCVVAAREDIPGHPRLVAYVVGTDSLDLDQLQAYLRAQLPDHMVPKVVMPLAELPLTPNGKVNRSSLPAPDPSLNSRVEYVQPRNDLEQTLLSIWQSLLQVDQVGIHHNFFELGGNSLLLVRAHAAIQEKLGLTLSVVELFAHPTIKDLSDYLASGQGQQVKPIERDRDHRRDRLAMKQRRLARQRHRSR
ncbi:MAG: amino acid adenylation domain-containing protein [Cyanobacteria bacterium P01_H01_bin.21]